MFISVFSVVIP